MSSEDYLNYYSSRSSTESIYDEDITDDNSLISTSDDEIDVTISSEEPMNDVFLLNEISMHEGDDETTDNHFKQLYIKQVKENRIFLPGFNTALLFSS